MVLKQRRRVKKGAKRCRIPRGPRKMPVGFLNVKRKLYSQSLTNATPTAGLVFRLSDLPNPKEFAMFDNFRLCAIRLDFVPLVEVQNINRFKFYGVYDNNASAPTVSSAALLAYPNCVRKTVQGKPWHAYFKPRLLAPGGVITGSGSSTVFAQKAAPKSQWLTNDVASTTGTGNAYQAPHFGYYALVETGSNTTQTIDIWTTYYFQFKGLIA